MLQYFSPQGSGPHFCTGGWKTEEQGEISTLLSYSLAELSQTYQVARLIRGLTIPTIAVVHGKLIGGGIALALAGDFIVAEDGLYFLYILILQTKFLTLLF